MKAHLMYADRDFEPDRKPPAQFDTVRDDLDLDTLVAAMAAGDDYLASVATAGLAAGLTDVDAIAYRQHILRDCLHRPDIVREIYALTVDTIRAEKQIYRTVFSNYPEAILRRSIEALDTYIRALAALRGIADTHGRVFRSPGFVNLFAMLTEQLDDAYLDTMRQHLRTLEFRRGVTLSAELGSGNKGTNYTLRTPRERGSWLSRLTGDTPPHFSFTIPDRDEAGARALGELRGRGIDQAANALAQSTDHIGDFFAMLRAELGFYVACLNLHDRLSGIGAHTSFPEPAPAGQPVWTAHDLYDVCLALRMRTAIVTNDVDAGATPLTVVTGANRGGKSKLLRSVGQAQVMVRAGMYTAASGLSAAIDTGLFTHFKREEDATMESGKLDEELRRMSDLADLIEPGAVVLLNESFAATDEREGSAIARQVIDALIDAGVRVFCVTHLYDLAHHLYQDRHEGALFLRAERGPDGNRTFKVVPGEPLSTSFGDDVYAKVFGTRATATV